VHESLGSYGTRAPILLSPKASNTIPGIVGANCKRLQSTKSFRVWGGGECGTPLFCYLINLHCILGLLFAVNVLIFIAKEYHNKLAMGMKGHMMRG